MTTIRLATVLLLSSLSFAAQAATHQVGPGRAFTQLTQVANIVNPGDVVEVDGNATYNFVAWTRNGSAALPITIRGMAQGAQRPVINAGGNADAFRMDVNHYVVEDLVISNASTRCIYLRGNNITLRRVVVHTCTTHGILGSDTLTGDMLLTEVEVYNQGNSASPQDGHHPIYISTDQVAYPNAVLRIEKSWIHDNHSGNSIKSRAKTVKVFNNWIEATNGQASVVELLGPDPEGVEFLYPPGEGLCPVPNGSNDADLCNGEVVGNVLIARQNPSRAFMMRLGSDGTGHSRGRYHLVNNTIIAGPQFAASNAMIRAFGPIQSIEMHNNLFWIANGDSAAMRIVRDVEAEWVNGRRVTGTRNLITGTANSYNQEPALSAIQGLANTVFTTTASVFANVNTAALTTPANIDVRIPATSPARNAGNAGNTSTAGYQIPSPANRAALEPPRIRPDASRIVSMSRAFPVNAGGDSVANLVSVGAYEFASARADLNGDGNGDLVFQDATGNIAAWTMDGTGVLNAAGLLPAGSGWSITHTGDFNGDGKFDLLLRHTDGRVLMWIMNGVAPSSQVLLQPAASGWTVTHVADMNADGKADILWENTAGVVAAWTMNGGTLTAATVLQPAASGWHITHMADLNGDGKADILWQHTDGTTVAWIMDGLNYVSSAGFTPAGSGWSITATGDVNGDGKADLAFRKSDGAIMLWVMNGTSLITFAALQNAGSPWRIDLIGDLDGDGKADLVWRNTADGSTYASLMNGTATLSAGYLMGAASGWTATHLRDLNGDGRMDILWRYTDGTLATWIMNGIAPIDAAGLIGPSTWQFSP